MLPPQAPAERAGARAPAKINLSLHVLGRRADGYHELESLVTFAALGDRLTLAPGPALSLEVTGPFAGKAGASADNLVLKAAARLAAAIDGLTLGHFTLDKALPVAAGIGGGSADAAAALRLIARANGLAPDDPRLLAVAQATGADVPVCLDPRPRMMRGIGEKLSAPLALPPLPAVLVNPGVPVATAAVFGRLALTPGTRVAEQGPPLEAQLAATPSRDALLAVLAATRNDLEPAAMAVAPEIATVLAALRAARGCRIARMSGSGATCFALFATATDAEAAAQALHAAQPAWWVAATTLG
jgi:4-diphosphocytidyl-2-C-methyl-D-erythritol kinase